MSAWFQVPDQTGPLEDVHRVIPKPLLHCLGCVCRVIIMLEGQLLAQSEVLNALNQVFIKIISVFSCIQLSIFSELRFIRPENLFFSKSKHYLGVFL